jgi:hypothetical protein
MTKKKNFKIKIYALVGILFFSIFSSVSASPVDSSLVAYDSTASTVFNVFPSASHIVPFNSIVYDTSLEFNTSSYKFTTTNTGLYSITGGVNFGSTTSGSSYTIYIYKNTSQISYITQYATGTGGLIVPFSFNYKLSANDVITIQIYGGATILGNGTAGSSGTQLSIARIPQFLEMTSGSFPLTADQMFPIIWIMEFFILFIVFGSVVGFIIYLGRKLL